MGGKCPSLLLDRLRTLRRPDVASSSVGHGLGAMTAAAEGIHRQPTSAGLKSAAIPAREHVDQ